MASGRFTAGAPAAEIRQRELRALVITLGEAGLGQQKSPERRALRHQLGRERPRLTRSPGEERHERATGPEERGIDELVLERIEVRGGRGELAREGLEDGELGARVEADDRRVDEASELFTGLGELTALGPHDRVDEARDRM